MSVSCSGQQAMASNMRLALFNEQKKRSITGATIVTICGPQICTVCIRCLLELLKVSVEFGAEGVVQEAATFC